MKKVLRPAFTLVELLVVIAIIGILIGLLMPAVQQIREAARRTACMNKLRQIGLAATMFHDVHDAFPPARLHPKKDAVYPFDQGQDQPSWLVRILPFIEQQSFSDQWDLTLPYSEHPSEVISRPMDLYVCPTRRTLSEATAADTTRDVYAQAPCGCGGWVKIKIVGGATGDFAGNHGDLSPGSIGAASDYYYGGNGTGVIISSQAQEFSNGHLDWIDRISYASITDGSSNTILAGELHVQAENLNQVPFNGPIYNGEDLAAFTRVGGPGVPLLSGSQAPVSSVLGFGSWHPDTSNFVFADGSTRAVANQVDTVTLGQLCNRGDGGTPTVN